MKKSLYSFTVLVSVLFFIACNGASSVDNSTVDESTAPQKAEGVSYRVTPGTSVMMWEGYKPGRTHTGTVEVANGKLIIDNGTVTGGLFSIDLTTITVTDLESGKGKEKLEAHLKGTEAGKENDFFNIQTYPAGTFSVTKITALEGDDEANHMIYGDLKLKGIVKNIGFRAFVEVNDNMAVVTSPLFKINRTDWNLKHMSRNFFDNLGDNFIQDEIGLSINLVAAVETK